MIGGDGEKTSLTTTCIFPDPPVFDLAFRREWKGKHEEEFKGGLNTVKQGRKHTQNADFRSRFMSIVVDIDWQFYP